MSAAPDRPFDVVRRHVVLFGVRDDGPKARVHVRVAASRAGCDRQFLDQPGKHLAALRVGGALLVLD